jgi:UDP-N-acetylmuramyl pentapeptide phosphotransferase/UDP-N-acetylglucosamine-1-phosphate transferase
MSELAIWAAWLLGAFGLSVCVILLRLRFSDWGLATPNARSLHVRPTPHGGGLGVVLPVLVALFGLGFDPLIAGLLLTLVLISWLDDVHPQPFWRRLIVHAVCAFVAVLWLEIPSEFARGYAGIAVLLGGLGLIWSSNAYNFMDGSDGLAGLMGFSGFGSYALAFLLTWQFSWGLLAGVISLACAGFLVFNRPPARIFMGDVGSIPLGFLAGFLGLAGWVLGVWPGWFPLWVFGVFWVDASVTLWQRIRAGKPFWQAHREHLYQELALQGLGHDGVLKRFGAAMLLMQIGALGLLWLEGVLSLLATVLAVVGIAGLVWARLFCAKALTVPPKPPLLTTKARS